MDTTQATGIGPVPESPSNPGFLANLFLRKLRNIENGRLIVTLPNGYSETVGKDKGEAISFRVKDNTFFPRVLASGAVGFGEAYVDGTWETSDLDRLLNLLGHESAKFSRLEKGYSWVRRIGNMLYHSSRKNSLSNSKRNIQEHYDLSNAFYQTFLDPSMSYSAALFDDFEQDLETAQYRKLDRVLELADIQPADRVLEIGSGWGALAIRAAGKRGAQVDTVTLSEEQLALAEERIRKGGLEDQIDIRLQDYRELEGQYNAIVSVEMIEAVGREYLESYFDVIQRCLKPGGRAVIQCITIPDHRYKSYCKTCDWIQKHIFPGGHLPSPGLLKGIVSNMPNLEWVQMDSFGLHYAETLQRWQQAFNEKLDDVRELGFDDNFIRKWRYYLSYCEAGFRNELISVEHIVIRRV